MNRDVALITGLALHGCDTAEAIAEYFLPDTDAMIQSCQTALRSPLAHVRDMAKTRIKHLREVRRARAAHRSMLLRKIQRLLESDFVQWHIENRSYPGRYVLLPFGRALRCNSCGARITLVPCPKCYIGEESVPVGPVADMDVFEDGDGEPSVVPVTDALYPTDAAPGTARKIEVMAWRRANHQRLYHPDDETLTPRQFTKGIKDESQ